MKIFKREFNEKLTEGLLIGECIITKCNNSEYGNFIVHRKVAEGTFPYLGLFGLLEHAVKFVQEIEKNDTKYEYYLQSQAEKEEGWDRKAFEVMGQLGWELCGIDSNITDSEGKSMYIYKRELKSFPIIEDPIVENEELWKATQEQLKLRNTITSKIIEYSYSKKDEYTTILTVYFGKNGLGLTNELLSIGKQIEELSKTNLIYIEEAFIDTIDDVYTLVFIIKSTK